MDLNEWVENAFKCKYLPENELNKLCDYVGMLLNEECNIQPVATPVTICGDIHGQFYDLLELFKTGGDITTTNYIFMGDFVDRGYYSLETLTLLLALKAKYPAKITLLRGNHETRQITQVYGFYDECLNKYGNSEPWKRCCRLFDLMTIGALIDDKILCVHGGLSPEINTLDQIQLIDRNQEIPQKGPFCDLVWSDPDDLIRNWRPSPRGAGYLFGEEVTSKFLDLNGLNLMCRAHQLIQEGIRYQFNNRLVTVWSAPNYCYRCGNKAAVLAFQSTDTTPVLLQFDAVPDDQRVIPPKITTPYFL